MVLKVVDWIIIILYGSSLKLDDLQFAYQEKVSATMCTWTVLETIEYFIRHGSDGFAASMDMSKAFDSIRHFSQMHTYNDIYYYIENILNNFLSF